MTLKTRLVVALALLSLVAACGADGAPKSPEQPAVKITGTARVGVSTTL